VFPSFPTITCPQHWFAGYGGEPLFVYLAVDWSAHPVFFPEDLLPDLERDLRLGERDLRLGERDLRLGERDLRLGERDLRLGDLRLGDLRLGDLRLGDLRLGERDLFFAIAKVIEHVIYIIQIKNFLFLLGILQENLEYLPMRILLYFCRIHDLLQLRSFYLQENL
jgi:hypothetical protein